MEISNLNPQTEARLSSTSRPGSDGNQPEEPPLSVAGDNRKEGKKETRTICAVAEKEEAFVQTTANGRCPNCGNNYTKANCPRLRCRFKTDSFPVLPTRCESDINPEPESHSNSEPERVSLCDFFTRKDLDRLIALSKLGNVIS